MREEAGNVGDLQQSRARCAPDLQSSSAIAPGVAALSQEYMIWLVLKE